MNSPSPTPASKSLLTIFLPWLLVVLLAGTSWKFYTAFKESNGLAEESMNKEKAIGEYLGGLCEEAKSKHAQLVEANANLEKKVADAEATTISWREQFNTLGLALADSEKARLELQRKLDESSKAPHQASN